MRQQRAKLSDELDRGMSNKAKNEEEQLHQACLFFSLANFNILSFGNIVFFLLYTNLSFPNVNRLSSESFRYENGGTSIFWVHGELVLASKFYLICFHHCILKIKINDE